MGESVQRSLVLLDVDGVVHDAAARDVLRFSDNPESQATALGVVAVHVFGRLLALPTYMPILIQSLVAVAEVHWCTTWKARANEGLCTPLGIDPLPVVDDGTGDIGFEWKVRASRELVSDALDAGRSVFWVEDFRDAHRLEDPRVVRIDTTAHGIVRPSDIDPVVRSG